MNTATWTAASSVGYTVDTNAAYNYISIPASGTPLALADDGEANITIPWGATFFGVTSSDLRVGNNGAILFDATVGEVGVTNAALPAARAGSGDGAFLGRHRQRHRRRLLGGPGHDPQPYADRRVVQTRRTSTASVRPDFEVIL